MAINRHVLLPRSSRQGKKPNARELEYGELAINYNADHEFLSVKNSSGNVITFSSDNSQEGLWKKGTGESAVKLDSGATASGKLSVAEGKETSAQGDSSHAEGSYTTAKGYCSHAEGNSTTASDSYSHAEGYSTTASGDCSHAEGSGTNASGPSSHAEGGSTTASGPSSHAEGWSTTASGDYSHAEGLSTNATTSAETAVGKYNVSNGKQIFSVGIGTSDTDRKNAFEINHDGTINLSATTFNVTGNTYFSGDTYFSSGDTYISFSAATGDIWSAITDDEEVVAAALNDLNDRKLDYTGLSGDSIISVVNTSSDNVTLSHKTGVVVNSNGVSGTAGKLTVNQTDEYGHIIATRDATAADIEGLGVASKGLVITYGTVKTLPTGYTYGTARTYDGKTVMNLSVPQKITDLEGGNDLSYVHLSGDTMYGKLCLKATSASTANTITLNNADGTITATTMFSTSDKRLKENIKEISDDEIEKVKNVDLKSFKYINDRKQHFGVIAQELEESGLGELVSFDSNGYKTVDYISLLTLKIAELEKEIKKLKDNKED